MKLNVTYALAAAALMALPMVARAADNQAANNPATSGINAASTAGSPTDLQVLSELQRSNVMEIEMGKLAKSNAKSPAIKDFGGQLVSDHQDAQQKTKDVAAQLGVKLPDESQAMAEKEHAEMSKLKALRGAAFDSAFAKEMASDHTQAIAQLETDKQSVTGPTAALIEQLLPVLKQHAETAKQLALNPNSAPATQKSY